jgi:1-hydroxycarotenoid 3,4-desaturase
MREPRIVIVGAGVGGMAAAADLASAGCSVAIFERAARAGGKLAPVELDGQTLDSGPTVLTMRWVFDELFAAAGRDADRYLTLERADVLARHAWPDGAGLDLFADVERSAQAIAEAFGQGEADAFLRFQKQTRAIYETVERPFLRSQRPSLRDALREARALGLGAFARVDALRTMAQAIERSFRDPHLRQLFGRYATYVGASPHEAPATLNLIAHVEQLGVHRVGGGMRALAGALETLVRDLGVDLRFGAHVERIAVENDRCSGVVLASGERVAADAVVFNGDAAALAARLLGEGAANAVAGGRAPSFSAITWTLLAEAEGVPLVHHNVFFGADPAGEFRALLEDRRVGADPTIYLCAQSRGDVTEARGPEPMLLVVNAPPTGDAPNEWNDEVKRRCERTVFSTLGRCGLTLRPKAAIMTTPADFHRRFPGTSGALYGPRGRGALFPLTRQGARSRLAGLYLAGGSVHPGPGVPMAALSGRLAARTVIEDLGSMLPSRPAAAINGTTSTR